MKYPQLVSARAVNAISDWLVARLEQLGVEAPQIYTRLLLSLLQSTVQLNDPIEFSNLETFFANRKGGHRRHLPCDTDTLKKLNAVQCLREIVSSEQELTTIENLVDELCEKLKDIEKQTAEIEDESSLLVVATVSPSHDIERDQKQQSQAHSHTQQHVQATCGPARKPQQHGVGGGSETAQSEERRIAAADIETDPKKRYFRAFPALSKEMEDSFRVWRRNAKSLTWPVNRSGAINQLTSSSCSSSNSNSNTSANKATAAVKCCAENCKQNCCRSVLAGVSVGDVAASGGVVHQNSAGGGCLGVSLSNSDNAGIVSSLAAAGVKRKTKRRRNQALSKGKTLQNTRKILTGESGSGARHGTPTFWDTDFEGCWEMGPDLIKDFIAKQNRNNRNRSTSESAAYNLREEMAAAVAAATEQQTMVCGEHAEQDDAALVEGSDSGGGITPLAPVVDMSFCCDDEYDDTLASVAELPADNSSAPRRLYEREAHCESREPALTSTVQYLGVNEEQKDFAQFKAKFNSSVEALWKDAEVPAESNNDVADFYSLPVCASEQKSELPGVAPFQENLKNFWTNYYSHHLDVSQIPTQSLQPEHKLSDNSCLSYNDTSRSLLSVDAANTSDYFSMPSNVGGAYDKSLHPEYVNDVNTGNGKRISPIGVFFQNSIWSDNTGSGVGDTDESFYLKVWNSNKKLSQMEAQQNNKGNNLDMPRLADVGGGFNFQSYNVSKWSEGINVGPSRFPEVVIHMNSTDCTDSSTTASVSTTSCSSAAYTHAAAATVTAGVIGGGGLGGFGGGALGGSYNWDTPALGPNLQADLQSWSTSNPVSLTEMYGDAGSGEAASDKRISSNYFLTVTDKQPSLVDAEVNGPAVTLPNHAHQSSGFTEYARIKSTLKACRQETIVLQQLSYATQYPPRPNEHYAEDENLLTSERTHFHPIKTYMDGHTFAICSALDVIEYERSASGYLCLEADKYLEYTPQDSFLAEDDGGNGSGASATPLYASSNCEAAARVPSNIAAAGTCKKSPDFVLKFKVQRSDIACQTEDDVVVAAAAAVNVSRLAAAAAQLQMLEQHPLCLIFSSSGDGSGAAAKRAAPERSGEAACNDAIEALNKAVAAAAKAVAGNEQHNIWENYSGGGGPMWTAAHSVMQQEDEVGCDDVDFCASNALERQWAKCEHTNNNNPGFGVDGSSRGSDNNNADDNNSRMHTLWGMCAACNSELKSAPPNRMLRDELQLEADEIMSDLKYMQDLYIGRTAHAASTTCESNSDWDDAETEEAVSKSATGTMANETPQAQEDIYVAALLQSPPETQLVLQKVNRLIANLLRPEGSDVASPVETAQSQHFVANLWEDSSTVEHDIWQAPTSNVASDDGVATAANLRPLELLRHFNIEPHANALRGEEDKFLAQLSWQHTNLAKIWQDGTPPPASPLPAVATSEDRCEISAPPVADAHNGSAEETPPDIGENTVISDKNKRNLRDGTASEQPSTTAAYKRVQQFLSASVASSAVSKLKLANRKRRHSASQNYFHHHHHYHHHHQQQHATSNSAANHANNNNNNLDVADLNCFNLKLRSSAGAAVFVDDIEMQKFINTSLRQALTARHNATVNNNNNNGMEIDGSTTDDAFNVLCGGGDDDIAGTEAGGGADGGCQPNKQTIITCKYWTTLDPMLQVIGAGGEAMATGGSSADLLTDDMANDAGATLSCLIDKNASILKHVTMVTRPLTR